MQQSEVNVMESRVRVVMSGLGACAALGLFLVGVPVFLVKLVGNPLPSAVPSWSVVVAAVEGGSLPVGALSGVLAVAVWIWWSQVVLSVAAEVWSACRGRTARRLPLRGFGMQPIMVRLVAVVATAAGAVGTLAQPTLAATPSFAEIAVPMEIGGVSSGLSDETGSVAPTPETGPVAAMGSSPVPVLELPEVPVLDMEPAPPVPVLGVAGESRPARAISKPASAAAKATSARWDPVLESETVERADQMPMERADQVSAPEPGEPAWVVVKPGDSLWLLAELHLGDAMRWGDIFELNAGQLAGGGTLRDPNLIHPGWRLRLPPPDPPAPSGPEVAAPARLAPR